MLTPRNLRTLELWGESLAFCENYDFTKWDQNLLLKLINERRDLLNKNNKNVKKNTK